MTRKTRQEYLGETLSQSDFFKKINTLEIQARELTKLQGSVLPNKYMDQRQDMLENLLNVPRA